MGEGIMSTRAKIPQYSDLPPDTDKSKLEGYTDLPPDTDHEALASTQTDGTPAESYHGVKEFGRDLWGAVKGQVKNLVTPTADDDARTGESHGFERVLDMTGLPGASAGFRGVKSMVEGTQSSIDKMKQAHAQGDDVGAVMHGAQAFLPLAGQISGAGDIYDKAKSGDTSGAVGTGLSRILQVGSLGSEESGRTGRVVSAPARAAGRLVAGGVGLAKDTATGAVEGFRRESGVVARPVNAAIEGATAAGKRIYGPTPMLDRMTKTPVGEKFAPTEVKADAQDGDHPIDMSAGEISGHPTLQRIQQVGERSLTGGEPVRDRVEGAQRAIADRVNDLKEGYAPGDKVPDTETAGLTVQKQAQASMQKLKASAQAKFDKWVARAGNIDVDMGDINDKYSAKLASMDEALKGMPETYSRPIRQLLNKAGKMGVPEPTAEELAQRDLVEQIKSQVAPGRLQEVLKAQGIEDDGAIEPQPGQVKMSSAQMLRSAYSDIANNFTGNIPSTVQQLAGELYHDIDGAMESSAKTYSRATGKRGVMKGYRDANAEWSQMQTLYNTPGEPLYRTLKSTEGQKVMNQLLEPGTNGGSPKNIRVLRDQGVDLGPLQREVVERIHNKNFGMYGKTKLGGFSDPFLRELFGPVGMEELHMLGKQARSVNYNVNPSGTAGVMSATHDLTDVAKAGGQMLKGGLPWYLENPFIKYGAAKLANNPAFNDWMTNTKGAAVEPGGRQFRPGKGPGAMLNPDSNLEMSEGPMSKDRKALYHVTDSRNIPSILREGLQTPEDRGMEFGSPTMDADNRWATTGYRPDSIYAVRDPRLINDVVAVKNDRGELPDNRINKQSVVSFRSNRGHLRGTVEGDEGSYSHTGSVPANKIKDTYDLDMDKSTLDEERFKNRQFNRTQPSFRIGTDKPGFPEGQHIRPIHDAQGKAVGDVEYWDTPAGIEVSWVGNSAAGEYAGDPHIDLGVKGVRDLMAQLKAENPDIKVIMGDRISGMRAMSDKPKQIMKLRSRGQK